MRSPLLRILDLSLVKCTMPFVPMYCILQSSPRPTLLHKRTRGDGCRCREGFQSYLLLCWRPHIRQMSFQRNEVFVPRTPRGERLCNCTSPRKAIITLSSWHIPSEKAPRQALNASSEVDTYYKSLLLPRAFIHLKRTDRYQGHVCLIDMHTIYTIPYHNPWTFYHVPCDHWVVKLPGEPSMFVFPLAKKCTLRFRPEFYLNPYCAIPFTRYKSALDQDVVDLFCKDASGSHSDIDAREPDSVASFCNTFSPWLGISKYDITVSMRARK